MSKVCLSRPVEYMVVVVVVVLVRMPNAYLERNATWRRDLKVGLGLFTLGLARGKAAARFTAADRSHVSAQPTCLRPS